MGNYTIKYRTFDQLLASVKSDMESYDLEGLIKPHQLIKIAKRVNKELGLKIYKTKAIVLEIENGKARLPEDLVAINYSYLLGRCETVTALPQGTHVEEVPLEAPTYHPGTKSIDVCAEPDTCPQPDLVCPDPCDPCQSPEPCGCNTCKCSTWINCKGDIMQLIQKIKYQTRRWKEFYRIKLTGDDNYFDALCPNKSWVAKNSGFIREGWVYTTFKTGELYLHYQGMLEDEDGNLLVLDHDMINEYYEYAFKERINELLMGNNETVNANYVKLVMQKFRESKAMAHGIVNTPDFDEIKEIYDMNREAMFRKYYKMFM
jgi:hypothetical protein